MSIIATALTLAAAVVVAFAPTATEATPIQSLQIDTAEAAFAVVNEEIVPTALATVGNDYICNKLKSDYNIDLAAFGPWDFPLTPYNLSRGKYGVTFCGIPNRFGCNGDAAVCYLDSQHFEWPNTLSTFDVPIDDITITQYRNGDVALLIKGGPYHDKNTLPDAVYNFRCTKEEQPEWAISKGGGIGGVVVEIAHQSFCKKQ